MANSIDIVVPDLGDFSDVEVIEVLVSAGDRVAREDGLITLETDKASMDVPSPADGMIETLTVSAGDRINSGDVIGTMSVEADGSGQAPPDPKEEGEASAAQDPHADEPAAAPGPAGEQTLTVPDIGDFTDVDVIEVHISEGQAIGAEDALITLETDKASMDVPAEVGGTIRSVLVTVGDKVSMGSPIAVVEVVAGADQAPARQEAAARPETPAKPAAPAQAPKPVPPAQPGSPSTPGKLPRINEAGFARAHASPSVRKLARELGVDLVQVKGSGPKNRVMQDDVKAFVKAILTGQAAAPAGTGLPQTPKVDFAKFGEIELQPLTRIQKISGPRLQASWINLPHVTQHDLADITELEARRQKLKGPAREKGIPLTPLAFILKACVAALQEFPKVNASLSDDGDNLVMKKYVHLGFAADTDQGLVVPVIRDADQKDVYELARELGELSLAAREGKLKADQMQGATFTVSSLGGIGGTAFTPIVNSPEVAILGVSRHSMQPVWTGEKFRPRLMLPLSFSYDHRVIDGAMAVRFTTFLGEALGDVDSLLQAIP
ncbi:MAG: dihydrolipoamide acetyltransferase [Gammaproteobacteria bacterium]|nr:dihydrolipoamide acetyltransferase [Gammaproteobacteria bacterium]